MDHSKLRINGGRLRQSLEIMSKIGATPGGGVQRLTLTDEDKEARLLLIKWFEELNMSVSWDAMGNIFGRRAGQNNDLAPVMSGSHVDSQPKGGRFDGILGVMAALEAARTMHENNVETIRPFEVVDWTNEEGSRFPPAMIGSGVWAGKLDLDWAYTRTDINGKKFGDELERIGFKGSVPAEKRPVHAYFEMHIEQGPVLEREGKLIGIPKGIFCLHWYDVYLEGTANQVGPTPMKGRNDALVAAAEMILKVRELPGKMGGNMVATVGEIQNYPNSRNIIPDKVHFTVDIRSWDNDLALRAWDDLEKDFVSIAEVHGCPMNKEITWRVENTPFDQRLVDTIYESAGELEYSRHRMVSGAGHDASYMTMCAPTAMIFVPSIGGRSHVEVEKTTWEDCKAGANVLLQSVLKTANEA